MPQDALLFKAGNKTQAATSSICRVLPNPGGDFKGISPDSTKTTLVEKLKRVTKSSMVQVAPNKYVPYDRKKDSVPEVTLCRWLENTDGTYFPMPFEERLVRLDKVLLKTLGMAGQYNTIRRLGEMGCIELIHIAPRLMLINLTSWFNHLRLCAEKPDIWNYDGEYIKEYRKAIY